MTEEKTTFKFENPWDKAKFEEWSKNVPAEHLRLQNKTT